MPVRIAFASLLRAVSGLRVGVACTPAAWSPASGLFSDAIARHADVRAFLALEHGLRGELQDGVHIDAYTDRDTGLPVYSFYGVRKEVPLAFLDAVDAVVFHAQDVSHRAYTFHWTLAELLRAAAGRSVKVFVLDRPTPLAHLGTRGPLATQFFPLPFPVFPALTMGELALWLQARQPLDVDLRVLPVHGWRRSVAWPQTGLPWIPPSPNLPTLSSAYAYACTGIVQASNVSEGRGTCKPFEYIGAPFLAAEPLARALAARRLPGVCFRPVYFQPGFNKFAGQVCAGVHLLVQDPARLRPLLTLLTLLQEIARQAPTTFELKPGFADWLDGASWSPARLTELDIPAYLAQAQTACRRFRAETRSYELYPNR